MRVAVVQQRPHGDATQTAAHQARLVSQAAEAGARLVVLPEGALTGLIADRAGVLAAAEPLDGPYVESLLALSAATTVAVVANLYERARADGRDVAYNTSVVVDRGELLGAYRKVHLFDAQRVVESDAVEPGASDQPAAGPVSVAGTVVGLMTCFDLRFAEQAVALARRGAEVLAVPAAWVAGPHKRRQWEVLLRARAIETGCYVAGAAQPGPAYCGGSAVYDPLGEPASEVLDGDEEGVAAADVAPAEVRRARATTPTLDVRPLWPSR